MNRTYFLIAAALLCNAALWAQPQPQTAPGGLAAPAADSYRLAYAQQAQTLAAGGGRAMAAPAPIAEKGKPFSATVTTQTTQTLADGTHVSQTTTTVQYRDMEGRVRTETGTPGDPNSTIVIRDPVAGETYRLDPARKVAQRVAIAGGGVMAMPLATARGGGAGGSVAPAGARGGGVGRGSGTGGGTVSTPDVQSELANLKLAMEKVATARNPNQTTEDLGTANVNGVVAQGTRITTVVPVGAIGNDREFRSVNERWFSSELNMLVKSVNSDPRFGTTTYEMTNISRQNPGPSLFQVPADYTVTGLGAGGRGGRNE